MNNADGNKNFFLVQGEPNGLRTAEISNWTGKAIAYPRNRLIDFFSREEIKQLER